MRCTPCKAGLVLPSFDWVSLFSCGILPLRNVLGEDMTCQRMGGELGEDILEENMLGSKGIHSSLGRKGREQFPRAT